MKRLIILRILIFYLSSLKTQVQEIFFPRNRYQVSFDFIDCGSLFGENDVNGPLSYLTNHIIEYHISYSYS